MLGRDFPLHAARQGYGLKADNVGYDAAAVAQRSRAVSKRLNDGAHRSARYVAERAFCPWQRKADVLAPLLYPSRPWS